LHLESGARDGTYCYAGEVFRRQEDDEARASEYIQVGYEVFGGADAAEAEAEVFVAINDALKDLPVTASMGDIGFLVAAIDGLATPDRRKAALKRHLWRPARFRALVERYSQAAVAPDPEPVDAPHIGLRSAAEIAARLETLADEARTAPLTRAEVGRLDAILGIREAAPLAAADLRRIAAGDTALTAAADRLEARLEALAAYGVDPGNLAFEASYGRTNLEYYDGFVFGFSAAGRDNLPPVATGGRYDALTARLGNGRAMPAVGAVIRPDALLAVGASS
jgi:ATP phosphoribosyltransferase regulatory subunit